MTRRYDHPIALAHPFWRYAGMFAGDDHAFLLDSALVDGRLGRHSFLGGRPAAVLTGRRVAGSDPGMDLELTTWKSPAGRVSDPPTVAVFRGDPFAALRDLREAYGSSLPAAAPPGVPFTGGLVGYFGYEAGYAIERLPDTGRDDLQLPDLAFGVYDEVLAHDHASGRTTLHLIDRGGGDGAEQLAWWRDRIGRFESRDLPPVPDSRSQAGPLPAWTAQLDRDAYCAAVQRCRDHIIRGDVFEVCLTNRLEMDLPGDPWRLYQALRAVNPAPFAAWLQFPGFRVVSASPERFLKLDAERMVESRPIKGTRPRGATPAEDGRLRAELAGSAKDRAENIMIVDLVRNDLGRVAEVGSVAVPELRVIEDYATVFQMVSTVTCRLRPDRDALDLVRACFPGGSMTGAPKIEAMKIIDGLEPTKRGVYSGAIGYLDHAGAMDLSIVIRTLVCKDGRCTLGSGGAVVADSDPAAEYQETLDKAAALIRAVGLLGDPSAGVPA
jgi:aminodeoxychorismate synthase component I